MAERQQPTPGEIVILAAGVVMLVFSFLNFANEVSAWGEGWFPIATLLPLYGLVMALQIGLTKFANVQLPDQIAGFTWIQIHLALGLMAGVMAIAWLISDVGDQQIGFWLEILGGVALAVGAVMLQRERQTGTIG